jgi:hypothetical protein
MATNSMDARKNFDAMNNFIGQGNPEALFWFVGIEDGGKGHKAADIGKTINYYGTPNGFGSLDLASVLNWQNEGTNIYRYMAYVISSGETKMMDQDLLNQLFQMNRYPLAKRNKAAPLPEHYKDLFGYGPKDRKDYLKAVKSSRFAKLRDFWIARKPKDAFTVCFGEGYIFNELELIFGVTPDNAEPIGSKMWYYSKQRLFVTPFFGRLNYDILKPLISKIHTLSVNQ